MRGLELAETLTGARSERAGPNRVQQLPEQRDRQLERHKREALDDVATYRMVSVKDLVDERFWHNREAGNKAIEALKQEGLLKQETVEIEGGPKIEVLTATKQGAEQARAGALPTSEQRYWAATVKPDELRQSSEVYRATRRAITEIEKDGGHIERVSLSIEIKNRVAEAAAKTPAGRESTAEQRASAEEAARRFELPINEKGLVSYPDAQIEYRDEMGLVQRTHNVHLAHRENRGKDSQARAHANGHGPRSRTRRARERDPKREHIEFEERKRRALDDVATYRVVGLKDLVDERFGGNRFAARKGIEALKQDGLLAEHTVQVKSGKTFRVLTATDRGRRKAWGGRRNNEQRYWAGFVKPTEIRHDAAVYQAARTEIEKLEKAGAKVKLIQLDCEMKSRIAKATEKARAESGAGEAFIAKQEAAKQMDLPLTEDGRVHYPDARIEYEDAQGVSGRVDVEVTSEGYRSKSLRAKAAAGFSLHANGRAAMRQLASALNNNGSKRGGGGGGGRHGEELFEL